MVFMGMGIEHSLMFFHVLIDNTIDHTVVLIRSRWLTIARKVLSKVDKHPGCICPYFSDATANLMNTSVYLDVHNYLFDC